METENIYSVKIFYSYAHEDKNWLNDLEKHLRGSRHVSHWRDDDIIPGAKWSTEIDDNLNNADVILLLISPDFKASDYCTKVEMKRALERHEAGDVEIIPISLRPVYWENPPYKNLQTLPQDNGGANNSLSLWKDKDDACAKVAASIYRTINYIVERQEFLKKYINDGDTYTAAGKYYEAQNAYKSALALSRKDATIHEKLGRIFMRLNRYKEALESYEKALKIDDENVQLWRNKSNALLALNDTSGAQKALSEAIKRDEKNAFLYKENGDIFTRLEEWQEALEAYNKAIILNVKYGSAYRARAALRERMANQLLALAKRDQEKASELDISESDK